MTLPDIVDRGKGRIFSIEKTDRLILRLFKEAQFGRIIFKGDIDPGRVIVSPLLVHIRLFQDIGDLPAPLDNRVFIGVDPDLPDQAGGRRMGYSPDDDGLSVFDQCVNRVPFDLLKSQRLPAGWNVASRWLFRKESHIKDRRGLRVCRRQQTQENQDEDRELG